MKYQLCPKCEGQGIVSKPPWIPADIKTWSSAQSSYVCDVCKGKKVLLVNDQPRHSYNETIEYAKKMGLKINFLL